MEEANVQLSDVPRYLTAVLAIPTTRSAGSLASSSSALRQSYLALSALGAGGGLGGSAVAASAAMPGGGAGSHTSPMASFRSDLSSGASSIQTAAAGGCGGAVFGSGVTVGRGGEAGGVGRDSHHHHQHPHYHGGGGGGGNGTEGGGTMVGATAGASLAAEVGKDRKEGGRVGHFNRDRGKYVFNAADRH